MAVAHPPEPPRAARNPFAFDPRRYWYGRHVGVVVEARWATMAPGPWSPQRGLAAWRHQRLGRLRQVLSPPAAGLLEALLFGVRAGMDAGVQEAFRQSGISHLLAVSGLHVGLVAAGAGRLAAWSGLAGPARWAVTAVAAALYAALAGAGPPVNRAAVGAVLITAGPLLSRPVDGLNLLGAAACWALLPRPLSALDLSFRLSFLAVAGMLLLAGPLQALLPGGARARAVVRGLAAGIAAQLALAPLLAASFGELAWAGAPATVITLPPLALLLAAGGAWTLIDGVCPACAAPLIPALEGLAWTVARVGGLLARPGAVWSAPSPPGWWAALYYLWVFGWAADWRSTAERLRAPGDRRAPPSPDRRPGAGGVAGVGHGGPDAPASGDRLSRRRSGRRHRPRRSGRHLGHRRYRPQGRRADGLPASSRRAAPGLVGGHPPPRRSRRRPGCPGPGLPAGDFGDGRGSRRGGSAGRSGGEPGAPAGFGAGPHPGAGPSGRRPARMERQRPLAGAAGGMGRVAGPIDRRHRGGRRGGAAGRRWIPGGGCAEGGPPRQRHVDLGGVAGGRPPDWP